MRHLAKAVTVSCETIEAVTYVWRHTRLGWGEVYAVRRFTARTLHGPVEICRLMSRDGRQVTVTDRMTGFEELSEFVRRMTVHAHELRPSRWERITYGLKRSEVSD